MALSHAMTTTVDRDGEQQFLTYFNLPLIGLGIGDRDKRWIEVNDKLCGILGFSREELLQLTWEDLTHADDLDRTASLFEQVVSGQRDESSFNIRFVHKTGRTIHTMLSAQCVRDVHGTVEAIVVVINDITGLKHTERLNSHRNAVLQSMATGEPLDRILGILVDGAEQEMPNTICDVVLLDQESNRLRRATRRQLPNGYLDSMDGMEIGPMAGCCGAAAFTGKTVVIKDIRTDPRSADLASLLDSIPVRACWSYPICGASGEVHGVFVVFSESRRGPVQSENDQIENATNLAGIAIERHRVEEALRNSERQYRQLFELAPSGILVEDAHGTILDVNQELCRIFGESRDAIVGRHIGSLATHSTEVVASNVQETILKGQQAREVVNRRADGSEVHFAIREVPIPLADGSPGVLVISLDITKRKAAEKALQKSEARFRALAEHVRMIPFEADAAKCNFVYVGPQAESVLGYPREAWYETGFWVDKLHPDDREKAVEEYRQCGRSLNDYELEYRMIDINGSIVWIRDFVHVARENDRPVRLTGFLLDVTKRREAEQRTRELEGKMAHAARISTAGELMTGIVHELNQPLYAVLNYASACRNTLRTSEIDSIEIQELLDQIVEQAHRAGRTLNQMLRFVRRDSPIRSPADVAQLISEAVSMMEFESRKRNVVLFSEFEPNLPMVLVNRVQIQQVIINLLHNAFDACAETREVTGQVKVGAFQEGAAVVIQVEDNGPGIPPHNIPRVFQAFYSTKPEGVGIGLSISNTIVEAHDGRIEAANRETAGAVFRVVLPAWNGQVDR